jgi:CcmD family protein
MEGSVVYLFAALALTWVIIVGYLLMLGSRLSALQRELESLKRQSEWPSDDDSPDR